MNRNKGLALLRVAKARLRLSEDDYRSILESVGGARSASDLDARGFDAVMDRFRAMGFTSDGRKGTYGARIGMATPAQVHKVRELWERWASTPEETALNGWLEKTCKVSSMRFLTSDAATTAIVALKAMVSRKDARRAR